MIFNTFDWHTSSASQLEGYQWSKASFKRPYSFPPKIFPCTWNQFRPRIKDFGSQRKVHSEIILRTNVEADFSAFVSQNSQLLSPNGSLFCLKEQLMMLYIRDFLCTGHRCPCQLKANGKHHSLHFSFLVRKIFWRIARLDFLAFMLVNGEILWVGGGEVDTLQRTFPVWSSISPS